MLIPISQVRGVESRVERGQTAAVAASAVLPVCLEHRVGIALADKRSYAFESLASKLTGEMILQIGVYRLASGPRGIAAAHPVPGGGPGRERGTGVCADVRDATTGEGPEVHGAPRPPACQRTASGLAPHRRAVQLGLSRSWRTVRRDGEILQFVFSAKAIIVNIFVSPRMILAE